MRLVCVLDIITLSYLLRKRQEDAARLLLRSVCDSEVEEPALFTPSKNYTARERAVRSLIYRLDPLSEETIRAREGAIVARQESDKPSEALALGSIGWMMTT